MDDNPEITEVEEVVDPVVEEGAEEAPAAEAPEEAETPEAAEEARAEAEAPEEEAAEEKVDPTIQEGLEKQVEELRAELEKRIEAEEEAKAEAPVEVELVDPAADIVAQIEALEDEDPGAEIDAEIEELKVEAELARLSDNAQAVLLGRLKEIWLAEFTEFEQAKLIKSFIPAIRTKGKKKLIPIEKVTDLRFFAKDSKKVFFLALVKRGHFHLKVFHNPPPGE